MPKTRQEKETIVSDLIQKFRAIKSAIFIDFKGLKVKEIEKIRKICRDNKIDYLVAKKTLLKKALGELGLTEVDPRDFKGEIATVFGYQDEVAPAKIIKKFSSEHESLKIISGLLNHKFISMSEVVNLAKLPTKEELLAKVVGSIKAPISGLVNVLAGNLRGLVQVLNSIKESKNN